MIRKKKGQNTLEYIIILVAVIGVVVAFVATISGNNRGGSGLGKLMTKAGGKITDAGTQIENMTQ